MPSATTSNKGWLTSGLAIAILVLLGHGLDQGSTDRLANHPGISAPADSVRTGGDDLQHETTPSSRLTRLTRLAERTLDDTGVVAPPAWVSSAISVTIVAPADNALNVPVSTNVTVTFSSEINPTTVTSDSFRLLDGDLLPVPSQVSVDPAALHATLDPDTALEFSRVYTVELTDAVQDPVGGTLLPHNSQFSTGADPPQENLPDVSDEAVAPPNATQAKIGSAVSCAGDLDGDGLADFVTGAPGLTVGTAAEAGAVVVYFGSTLSEELVQPDIIFQGVSAHDRTGVAVAGGFDFNGDGMPDLLIGAEQVNRSGADDAVAGCGDGVPCGNGKVYLIFFDPFDATHYPNLGNPLLSDTVDLSLVGGAIPGVVFTGVALGDQAGFAVAGGGRVNLGDGEDLLIGAPSSDPGAPSRTDAGVAYVIFDNPSLTGTIALDRVASGEPDEIDGVVYLGGAPGDHFGFSVSFPGDVTGSDDDDLAIGAPGADTPAGPLDLAPDGALPDAGSVTVPEGGGLVNGIIESVDIGGEDPGSTTQGDQAGMELGYTVEGGGDTLVDGETDLLMGAPKYDRQFQLGPSAVDVGLVAHTASKLEFGIIRVSQIGAPDAVNGAIYTGTNDFDELGVTVAGLGDVTGDGFDDIAFAAPFADPIVSGTPFENGVSVPNGGIIYQVDGLVPSELNQGIIESVDIGDGVSGLQLVGAEENENAGLGLSGGCDVNGDYDLDFLVGAPGRDFTTGDNAGTVYIVVESAPDYPGTCGVEGCVVAHLETGAQIAVPPNSLTSQIGLAVLGVLDVGALPVPPPAGMTLLGATDFDPENQPFGMPLPTIHVPIRPELGGQFAGGEALELRLFLGGEWVPAGATGAIQGNPHYPSFAAVEAKIDTLHYYGAFIDDADGDLYWDLIDSDSADRFVCADTDVDACDDCSSGSWNPSNDGADGDTDGICDQGDSCTDADGDGVGSGSLGNVGCATTATDDDDGDPTVCADVDEDGCDDCSSNGFDPANDGTDTDSDGLCDLGDGDDDNDGVGDAVDFDPLDPDLCADADADSCDDCSVGTDGLGPLPDNLPANDGTDTDSDGLCDLGDDDDDDDGVEDGVDCASLDAQLWSAPGEVRDLLVRQVGGESIISWSAPLQTGTALPLLYDTPRSNEASDFVTAASCLESDGSDTESTDAIALPSGGIAFFLARAENGCGHGSAGVGPSGESREVLDCPQAPAPVAW